MSQPMWWKKRYPVKVIPKKKVMEFDPRSKRSWIPLVMCHDNPTHNLRAKALYLETERLFYLIQQDFVTPVDFIDLMEEFDRYAYTDLRSLVAIFDALEFPDIPVHWIMSKWNYIKPEGSCMVKLKWLDHTHPVELGKRIKPRYQTI